MLDATFRSEKTPTRPLSHLAVVGIYVAVGGTLVATRRPVERTGVTASVAFLWWTVLGAALSAFLLSLGAWVVGTVVPTVRVVLFFSFFVVGPVVGAANLALVGLHLTRRP